MPAAGKESEGACPSAGGGARHGGERRLAAGAELRLPLQRSQDPPAFLLLHRK